MSHRSPNSLRSPEPARRLTPLSDFLLLRPGGCIAPPAQGAANDDGSAPAIPVPAGLYATSQPAEDLALTLYDTWPWDLWHSGFVLLGDSKRLYLADRLALGSPLVTVNAAEPARFGWDLAPPLREIIGKAVDLRALLPKATLSVSQRWWEVRNADDKIVVRLLDQHWSSSTRTVQIVPLRGYDEEAREVADAAPAEQHTTDHPLRLALRGAGLSPQKWTNKPSFGLQPKERSRAAAIRMLRTLLALTVDTEDGIIADYDTEFLHDYRVLVRRARSVLSVMSGVFAPEDATALKSRFRALGSRTNRLRDLDVHLMAREEHEARVPEWMRPGLAALFDDIAAQRKREHAALAPLFRRATYRKERAALDAAIAHAAPGPRARLPIRKLAKKRVSAAMRRVMARGRSISPETEDAVVHELRIDCKKLRYTLEFFGGLPEMPSSKRLIRRLKKLQDILGAFNDLSVQQEALREWLETRKRVSRETAVAVGALASALAHEQRAVRSRVEEAFAAFEHGTVGEGWR